MTPWWGAGLFTLLGVALTQMFVSFTTWRRHVREDNRRWHDDVRLAIVAFMLSVATFERELAIYLAGPEDAERPDMFPMQEGMLALNLVAPEKVVTAAMFYVREVTLQTMQGALAKLAGGRPEVKKSLERRQAARHNLVNKTREYLGEPSLADISNERAPWWDPGESPSLRTEFGEHDEEPSQA